MLKKYSKILFWMTLFSIAMAYLESAVVVYLREIYYPKGFTFPLQDITPFIYITEIGREIATIIMLLAISILSAKNNREIFAFFSFNFAVWDIWYYIWLKILLDWPQSFLTWDVLFLIPIPWIAPVLAPFLVSMALLIAALIILYLEAHLKPLNFSKVDWGLEWLAGLIIIVSFLFQTSVITQKGIPNDYPWWLFFIGLIFGLTYFFVKVSPQLKQISKSD